MTSFAARLANKETLIGTIVSINSAAVVELMSQRDFDWLFIDAEHGALSIDSLENLVRASEVPVLDLEKPGSAARHRISAEISIDYRQYANCQIHACLYIL